MGAEAILVLIFTAVFAVIGYLLVRKDAEQGKAIAEIRADFSSQITLLFTKHDAGVSALHDLRLQIARDHYQKEELDARFNRLELAFQKGFDDLGRKFDHLSDVLIKRAGSGN